MHIKPKLIIISIILFVLFIGTYILMPDNKPINNNVTDAYEFPITPDKTPDEWKNLKDHGEMISVCQIPENVLTNISTEGLFETCMNYPLHPDLMAFNSYQYAFNSLCSFNGLQELINRSDAGRIILNHYKNIDNNTSDKSPFYDTIYIEMILAQESVLSSMELSDRKELLNIALKRSSKNDIGVSKVLVGRILRIDNKKFQDYLKEHPNIEEYINNVPVVSIPIGDWDNIVNRFAH